MASHSKSEVCVSQNFQSAHSTESFVVPQIRGLVGIDRFERCLFLCTNTCQSQKVPQVCLPGQGVSVQGAAFQPKHRSKGLHKNARAYHRFAAFERGTCLSILR